MIEDELAQIKRTDLMKSLQGLRCHLLGLLVKYILELVLINRKRDDAESKRFDAPEVKLELEQLAFVFVLDQRHLLFVLEVVDEIFENLRIPVEKNLAILL